MRTKLLKTVRKRYSITYHPNGGFVWGEWCPEAYFLLVDHYDSWSTRQEYVGKRSVEEVYNEIYDRLVRRILYTYKKHGKRRIQKAKQTTGQ